MIIPAIRLPMLLGRRGSSSSCLRFTISQSPCGLILPSATRRRPITHVTPEGTPTMVNVGEKPITNRQAHAQCRVVFPLEALRDVMQYEGRRELLSKKGPVFSTAIVAGVMGAKKTSELVPFCHPLSLEDCKIEIGFDDFKKNEVVIDCRVSVHGRTGVEMEALTGASVAALCIYDMCKASSHNILIKDLQLMSKSGGKRDFQRAEPSVVENDNIERAVRRPVPTNTSSPHRHMSSSTSIAKPKYRTAASCKMQNHKDKTSEPPHKEHGSDPYLLDYSI